MIAPIKKLALNCICIIATLFTPYQAIASQCESLLAGNRDVFARLGRQFLNADPELVYESQKRRLFEQPNGWQCDANYVSGLRSGLKGQQQDLESTERNAQRWMRDSDPNTQKQGLNLSTAVASKRTDICIREEFIARCANAANTAPPTQSGGSTPINQARPASEANNVTVALDQARQTQEQLDRKRQGQRKTHNPDAVAHQCVDLPSGGLFGALENKCNFKIAVQSCNFRPKITQGGMNWSSSFDCEQRKFGSYDIPAGKVATAHTNGTEMVYWFACKEPSRPVDVEYVAGIGVRGRCS